MSVCVYVCIWDPADYSAWEVDCCDDVMEILVQILLCVSVMCTHNFVSACEYKILRTIAPDRSISVRIWLRLFRTCMHVCVSIMCTQDFLSVCVYVCIWDSAEYSAWYVDAVRTWLRLFCTRIYVYVCVRVCLCVFVCACVCMCVCVCVHVCVHFMSNRSSISCEHKLLQIHGDWQVDSCEDAIEIVLYLYMCVCVCMRAYVCVCICMCVCVCMYMYVCVCVCTKTIEAAASIVTSAPAPSAISCMCMREYAYVCVCVYACVRVYQDYLVSV